jgi:hypothetical protein
MASVQVSVTLPGLQSTETARTFLQLQDEVLAHGFGARYRPRVRVWLNEALGKLARQSSSSGFEVDVAISVSPDVTTYTIPGSVSSVIDVRDSDGFHLTNVSREEIDTFPVKSGSPGVYSIFQGKLRIAPSPTKATTLRVRYRGRPARMSVDTDTAGIPSEFEDLLVHYALWHAYLGEDDPEMGNVHKQEWVEGVAEFRRDSQMEDESESRQIQGMMSRWMAPIFRRPT